MNDNQFRFLHVSDLHLCQESNRKNFLTLLEDPPSKYIDVGRSAWRYGPQALINPTSYNGPTLAALSEFVYNRPGAYDAILISGDLATSGTAIDHAIAYSYVDGDPVNKWRDSDNRPVLSQSRANVLVCPGNHDNYNGVSPRKPSNVHFVLKFGTKYLPRFKEFVGHTILAGEDHALAIIYADFGFQANQDARNSIHLYGGGRVHSTVIGEMVARTVRFRTSNALPHRNRSVVWMIHFAPYNSGNWTLDLTDRHIVIDEASRMGVKHILCGHTHEKNTFTQKGVTVHCAGAATAVDCANEIHEILYDASSHTVLKTDYKWSSDDGAFL